MLMCICNIRDRHHRGWTTAAKDKNGVPWQTVVTHDSGEAGCEVCGRLEKEGDEGSKQTRVGSGDKEKSSATQRREGGRWGNLRGKRQRRICNNDVTTAAGEEEEERRRWNK